MNHYGRLGHDHWAEWLPTRYHQIENPDRFFTSLGLEVAREIEAIMDATTIPTEIPTDQGPGWWASAKRHAENQTLAELVFLPPEEDLDEERPLDPTSPEAVMHDLRMEILAEMTEDETHQTAAAGEATGLDRTAPPS